MSGYGNNGERRTMNTAAKVGMAGARGVGSVIGFILKTIGTILLITLTSALIFACIFVIYIKTNMAGNLDLTLEEITLNLSSVIYAEDKSTGGWKELAVLQSEETRFWVDYEDMPADLEHAVVSIEDQRFYKHKGVDWYRTVGAFFNMFLSMKDTFGGSTLTQQLIKNATEYDDVTVQRKLHEILQALELERDYSKEEIVEYYLNLVYFGHGCYGIGAAASYYFDKEVSELSLAEMAAIVGITNNPSLYSPFISTERNKERQELILQEMYKQEYIDYDTYIAAKNEQLVFTRTEDEAAEPVIYSYFVDAVIEDALDAIMEVRGCTRKIASQLLFNSGYQIYATIDTNIQAKVDSIYTNLDEIPKPSNKTDQIFQSAIVITNPYTGDIVALAGGVGEKTQSRVLNRATQSMRAPGSSIKPIAVYAPAMDLGLITPNTMLEDSANVRLSGTTWMPHNDDYKYSDGLISVRTGIIRSKNTIAAQVLDRLTPQASYQFLTEKLHMTTLVESRDGQSDINYAPLSMGELTDGATVREMAGAYSIFPNEGIYTGARTFSKILDSEGKVVYENTVEPTAAISEVTAYWMTDMLHDAATSGTGSGANLGSLMPTAGKTGTSTSNRNRWFVGFTPYYVAAVWTGYDTPEKISVTGNPASTLWKKVMTLVHQDLEYKNFPKPENVQLTPVPGTSAPTADCIVRGVLADGTVIYEEYYGRTPGNTVSFAAPEIEGYLLIDDSEKTLTVSDYSGNNIVVFLYESDGSIGPDDPNTPTGPEDPSNTGDPNDPSVNNPPDEPGTVDPPANQPPDDPGTETPGDPGTSDPTPPADSGHGETTPPPADSGVELS